MHLKKVQLFTFCLLGIFAIKSFMRGKASKLEFISLFNVQHFSKYNKVESIKGESIRQVVPFY